MKAFFQRLGVGHKDKEPSSIREKFTWPPPSHDQKPNNAAPPPASPVPSSNRHSFKPLPEIAPAQFRDELVASRTDSHKESTSELNEIEIPEHAPSPPPAAAARAESPRNVRKPNQPDQKKQVAFKSPTQTSSSRPESPPSKTTISRFQAVHGGAKEQQQQSRASSSTAASTSKTDLAQSSSKASTKGGASTLRNTQSPYLKAESTQSLRSNTPYSQSSQASGSRIIAAASWSEVTEEDLVSNLGSRERTRQEVLFEIISSEER